VKVALAEGQVTILDEGLQPGQNVVVDGADRLKPGQNVTASVAQKRGGQKAGQGAGQGAGQSGGNPFAAPSAASNPGAPAGNGKPDKRNKQ
jgi:hypothetical protein